MIRKSKKNLKGKQYSMKFANFENVPGLKKDFLQSENRLSNTNRKKKEGQKQFPMLKFNSFRSKFS